MKMVLKVIGGIFSVIVLAISAMVLVQIDFSNDEDFDVFIEAKMKSLSAQGLALVFIKNGEVVQARNYGYADREAAKPVSDDSVFNIASLSKPVTGVAIMQLFEKGLIDLDASINRYLPFEITNPNFPAHKITVRMLLQHKSGLIDNYERLGPEKSSTMKSGLPDSDITLDEFTRSYFLDGGDWYDAEQNFSQLTPGLEYSYSNSGFALLGYLVEQVSGQPFNKYCDDNIFTPLGMETAGWFSTEVKRENVAVQYDAGTRLKPYSYPTYPAGSLKLSIQDYSKFLMAMTNGGVYNGKRILKEATVKEMLPENHQDNLVWADNVLEEFFIDIKEYRLQGHTGGDPGTFCVVAFNNKKKTAMILFMNGTPPLLSIRILNVPSFVERIALEARLF